MLSGEVLCSPSAGCILYSNFSNALRARHNDVLLLAGDISDDVDVIRYSLVTVRQAFRTVFYIPGNHELWVRGEPGDARDSQHQS